MRALSAPATAVPEAAFPAGLPADVSFTDVPSGMSTAEAAEVWRRIFVERQGFFSTFGDRIYPTYAPGLARLALRQDRFPTRAELDAALAPVGWRIAWVSGFIPGRDFANLLCRRYFPVASGVRALAHVEHAPSPDAIHDIWGHLPLLFDPEYTGYLLAIAEALAAAPQGAREVAIFKARERLGRLTAEGAGRGCIADAEGAVDALEAEERLAPELATRLSRLFLWSIEFGLVARGGHFDVVGAAILSSGREFRAVVSMPPRLRRYGIEASMHDILFTEPQQQMFVAEGFPAYRTVLDEVLALCGSSSAAGAIRPPRNGRSA